MKKLPAREPVPVSREETLRRQIRELLAVEARSARDISALIGIPEKEVAGHLEHLRHSLHREGMALVVTPAECLGCGFVFAKRERLTRPGRCPLCHEGQILAPLFAVGRRGEGE